MKLLILFCLLTLQAVNASSLKKILRHRNKNPVVLTVGKETGSNVEINIKVPINGWPIEIKKKGPKGETFQYISNEVYNAAKSNYDICTAVLSGSQYLQDFFLGTLMQPEFVQSLADGINFCIAHCPLKPVPDVGSGKPTPDQGLKREKHTGPGKLGKCFNDFIESQSFLSATSKANAKSGILDLITNPTSPVVQAGCAAAASPCDANYYSKCFQTNIDQMFASMCGRVQSFLNYSMSTYNWLLGFVCPSVFGVLLTVPAQQFVADIQSNLADITDELIQQQCPVAL